MTDPIGEWLSDCGLDKYLETFIANDIGVDVVADLTDRELRELGLSMGDRKRFLHAATGRSGGGGPLQQDLLDNLPVLVSYVDADETYRYVNRLYEEWHGTSKTEIIGRKVGDLVTAATYRLIEPHIRRVLQGENACFNIDATFEDGTERRARIYYVPDRRSSGDVQGFFTVVDDIGELEAAKKRLAISENALDERESMLRLVVDHLPVLITYVDSDRRFRLINQTCADWYGLAANEVIGRKVSEIHGDRYALFAPRIDRVLTGETLTFEDEILYPDGQIRAIRSVHVPDFDRSGTVRGYFSLTEDITEQKRAQDALTASEQRFRSVVDSAPTAIVLKDNEGRMQMVNQAYERFYDISAASVIGKTSADIYPADVAAHLEEVDRKVKREGSQFVEEFDVRGSDTATDFVRITKFPVYQSGKVSGVGTFAVDITAEKAAEKRLIQSQKMEAVGQLTGGIAHDFNNLLQVILSNAEMISTSLERDSRQRQAILHAAERGSELVENLLAFSRKQSLSPRSVDIDELVNGMTGLLQRSLGETIEIRTTSDPDLWPALADPTQIETALLNLAINARDAMAQGGSLSISCRNRRLHGAMFAGSTQPVSGDFVELSVSDDGAGMDVDTLNHAIEPFFTTKETGAGSGLGLSMVYGFARQSDGHIDISSEPGAGTTVLLLLPRSRQEAENVEEATEQRLPLGRGEVVFLVEDNSDVRVTTASMLEQLGYRTTAASDAREAQELIAEGLEFDLILSDVVLPNGLSGFEFGRKLLNDNPNTKIIFMTGYADKTIDGFDNTDENIVLLNKPFRAQKLAETLRDVLV